MVKPHKSKAKEAKNLSFNLTNCKLTLWHMTVVLHFLFGKRERERESVRVRACEYPPAVFETPINFNFMKGITTVVL